MLGVYSGGNISILLLLSVALCLSHTHTHTHTHTHPRIAQRKELGMCWMLVLFGNQEGSCSFTCKSGLERTQIG